MWDIFSQWFIIHIVNKTACLLFKKLFRNIWYRPIVPVLHLSMRRFIGASEASLYNIVICLSVMDVRHGFYRDPTVAVNIKYPFRLCSTPVVRFITFPFLHHHNY